MRTLFFFESFKRMAVVGMNVWCKLLLLVNAETTRVNQLGLFLFAFMGACVALPALALNSALLVVIDRVDVIGDANITPGELERLLEIPVGESLDSAVAAERLNEGLIKLKATGKYEDDLSLKLVKGTSAPHFVLEARLTKVSDAYVGFQGEIGLNPYHDNYGNSYSGTSRAWTTKAGAYTGSRDWNDSGWAIDLEFGGQMYDSRSRTNYTNDETRFSQSDSEKYRAVLTNISAAAIRHNLLQGHAYAGVSSTGHLSKSWLQLAGESSGVDSANRSFVGQHSHEHESTTSALAFEALAGLKWNRWTLGGHVSRLRYHDMNAYDNDENVVMVEGKEQPTTQKFTFSNRVKPYYRTDLDILLSWSEKPHLNIVEAGGEVVGRWRRVYRDSPDYPIPVEYFLHGEYTKRFLGRYAGTLIGDGSADWIGKNDLGLPTIRRILAFGSRLDSMMDNGLVLYGEFQRSGAKFREHYSYSEDPGMIMRSLVKLGVEYASPSMLYAFHVSYGSSLLAQGVFQERARYQRLGVH